MRKPPKMVYVVMSMSSQFPMAYTNRRDAENYARLINDRRLPNMAPLCVLPYAFAASPTKATKKKQGKR